MSGRIVVEVLRESPVKLTRTRFSAANRETAGITVSIELSGGSDQRVHTMY